MDIIINLVSFIVGLINRLLPVFEPSQNFIKELDKGIALFIELLEGVAYFLPLDILVICLGVMFAIDNFAIMTRLGQFILKMIRG